MKSVLKLNQNHRYVYDQNPLYLINLSFEICVQLRFVCLDTGTNFLGTTKLKTVPFHTIIQCLLEISLVRSKQLGKMYVPQLIYFVDCSVSSTLRSIYKEVFLKPKETFKLVVPAGLYVIQNSLLFVALSNLDSATYQVRKVF